MDNNFVLNVIWKEEKINKIDDENLSKKELEKFFYNIEKSKEKKLIFTKKNIVKEIKKNYIYAGILAISFPFILSLMEAFDFGMIAVPIIIGIGFSILGLVISPFTTYKNIIFEIDEYGQERILKQNVFGSISTIVNLKNLTVIKVIKDNKNTYFLVDEKNADKISENSIIFSVENGNQNLIIETEKFLNDFTEKEIRPSEIVMAQKAYI